jgi:hypothetical protein
VEANKQQSSAQGTHRRKDSQGRRESRAEADRRGDEQEIRTGQQDDLRGVLGDVPKILPTGEREHQRQEASDRIEQGVLQDPSVSRDRPTGLPGLQRYIEAAKQEGWGYAVTLIYKSDYVELVPNVEFGVRRTDPRQKPDGVRQEVIGTAEAKADIDE